MEALLIFLLKSSGITSLFLLFYVFLLKRETFFRANRIYLLAGLGLSILLPFVIFTNTIWLQPMNINPKHIAIFANESPVVEGIIDWPFMLFCTYFAGVFIFSMRFALQLFSVRRLIAKSNKFRNGKFIMVETDQNSSPFSFFWYVVYNPNLHTPSELKTILAHERIHGNRKHSFDIIIMHIFTIFQWCNPFIWWYRTCLDDNLEYLADAETIIQNNNKTEYQYLLLRTGLAQKQITLTTSFFNSSIKKRINMLNKSRSHRKNSFKYSLILPLMAGFIILFNFETEAQVIPIDSIQKDRQKYNPVTYDNELLWDHIEPEKDYIFTTSKAIIPYRFYLEDKNPLYLVNGKELSKKEFDKIDPNTIKSIDVLKDPKRIEKYGDKGKNGVVKIILKKEVSKPKRL